MSGSDANDQRETTNGIRSKIHEIIFGADTPLGMLFDVGLLIAIVLSVIDMCLLTVEGYEDSVWLSQLSMVLTILFTIEYGLRVYCVNQPSKYIFSFWGMVDLMSFLPDYLLLILTGFSGGSRSTFSVLRTLRLLRVFRLFKLGWFQAEADDLGAAVWRARAKIVVFITVVMVIVTVTGTLMYEIENAWDASRHTPTDSLTGEDLATLPQSQFGSIPEGIYWAIVTMTTVGFGDTVPVSPPGKFLSALLILLGYSLIIVPTGFVSAEIIESKRKKITTRSCADCLFNGHDDDAVYCKICGTKL